MENPFLEQVLAIIEPRVCEDLCCTYPFGQACVACVIHNEAQKKMAGESTSDLGTYYERDDTSQHYQQQSKLSRTAALEKSYRLMRKQQGTPPKPEPRLPCTRVKVGSDYLPPKREEDSQVSTSPHSSIDTNLDSWLCELEGQREESSHQNEVFIGGAEDHLVENPCPICSNPQGDPIFQHYLRCKYAHEEQERMNSLQMHVSILRGRIG